MKDMIFERPCVFCGKVHRVEVMEYQFNAWRMGELIQNAMPNTSAEDREFLISGICPKCQESIFGVDDDDLEDIDEDFEDLDIDLFDDDFDEDFDFAEFEPEDIDLPF